MKGCTDRRANFASRLGCRQFEHDRSHVQRGSRPARSEGCPGRSAADGNHYRNHDFILGMSVRFKAHKLLLTLFDRLIMARTTLEALALAKLMLLGSFLSLCNSSQLFYWEWAWYVQGFQGTGTALI
jgi:hypothetical protein